MYDSMRYWISPAGELIEVPDAHHRVSQKLVGLNAQEAIRQGWVRVIRDDNFGDYWYFEIQNTHDEEALELIGEFVLSPENQLTGDDVAASVSTFEPKTGSFPVEWKDLEDMSFVEAAKKSFQRELRRPEGYRWYELRGNPRPKRNIDDTNERIRDLVRTYLSMLGIDAVEEPDVILQSDTGSRWLGRWSMKWRKGLPGRPVIQIQRSVLSDPRTLERVVAHEVVHHVQYLQMDPAEIQLVKLGLRPVGHGPAFQQLAAILNGKVGEGFVTEKSDQEYVVMPSGKRILLLISPTRIGRLGWQWATRLGPKAREWVDRKTAEGARLVEAYDDNFIWTSGPRIEAWKGWAMPPDEQVEARLKELYESGR